MHSRKRKNILVTGGAGFLGSHLCERLLARGDRVLCLDNLSTGSLENLRLFSRDPHFTFIEADVAEPFDGAVDEIYNLACPASPKDYMKDPHYTVKTCVVGALSLLSLAQKRGIKILQASTSEVYGDPSVHPQIETYVGSVNPIGPRACYDEGKRCAEALFFDAHRKGNLPIKVARIFNTYGPRMKADDGRVVSTLIVQALRGEPLTLFGEGTQTRSFCYVDDLIDGLILFMDSEKGCIGPLNLGNPIERSMRDLADTILKLTGSTSSIIHLSLPQDDPKVRCPDITKAREQLLFSPKVSLEEGLSKTVAYFGALV